MARIAIVGVGAIGSVVAAALTRTGQNEVFLCVRRPLAALVVESAEGAAAVPATIVTDPAALPRVDWVFIATKAYDADGAGRWLQAPGLMGVAVAILQNGVEHCERFSGYAPPDRLLPVMVDCPAERDHPGFVRQRGPLTLRAPANSLGEAFVELFAGAGVPAATVDDFVTVLWRKLCVNAAGILSAILLRPNEVMHEAAIAEAARDLVRECVLVGRAEGAQLAEDVPDAVVASYQAAARNGRNSMLADRLAGRPMEIDARNGVIVRCGAKHGIATPCNRLAIAVLEAAVSGAPLSSPVS